MIRVATVIAGLTLLAPAAAGASSGLPTLSVAAWPARTVVTAPGRTTIHVDNPGPDAIVVDAAASGYALDLRGRPVLRPGRATGTWLVIRPTRVVVHARSRAEVSVVVERPRTARPGDHALVVLLTTRVPSGRKVLARLRIGVVVVVRVPGAATRLLRVDGLQVERRGRRTLLGVSVVNEGNLDEWISKRRLEIRLLRRGRLIATLEAVPRRLLARAHGLVEARSAGRMTGTVAAVVLLRSPRSGVAVVRRTFWLRL